MIQSTTNYNFLSVPFRSGGSFSRRIMKVGSWFISIMTDCKDYSDDCNDYASRGFCSEYAPTASIGTINMMCKRACGTCSSNTMWVYISAAFNPVTSLKIIKKHLVKILRPFEGNSCQSKPSILIHHGQLLFQAKIFNFKVECVSYTMSLSASKYRLPFFNNVSFMISDIKCSGMNHSPSFSESCSPIIQFFF